MPHIISWKTQHQYNCRSYIYIYVKIYRLYFCQAKPQVQSDAVEGPSLKAGKLERFRSSNNLSTRPCKLDCSVQKMTLVVPIVKSGAWQCEVCSHRVVLTLKNLHGAPTASQDITPAEGEMFWEDGDFSDLALEQPMGQCTAVFLLPVLLDPSDRRSADFGKVTGSATVALAMVILRIRSYCDMMLSTLTPNLR